MSEGAPSAPGFGEALRYWFKLGCLSFGGPAGQIALMQTELVEKRRWISQGRFLHALNYCMVLPGPEAQQLATYLGWLLHGVRGGIAAGVLFVLPSLLLMIVLSWAYLALGSAQSTALLAGVKPAVIAIVAFAAWRIGSRSLRQPVLAALACVSFAVLLLLPGRIWVFPLSIAVAALIGWMLRGRLGTAPPRRDGAPAHPAALIDDDTPPPVHARPDGRRLAGIAAAGLALGAAMFGGAWLLAGDSPLPTMAAFFTQAALITFGGAYAVMPYVFQAAVQTYGWLTPAQMMDGLALGETTPGPLIMVVAFIGYLGAAGSSADAALGIAGALVATVFTFLPSFLFILLGAPFVERSRGLKSFAGPLAAISAVVVAAILQLAVALAIPTLLPGCDLDVFALALASAGLVALIRGWLGIVPLLLVGAALGWLRLLV